MELQDRNIKFVVRTENKNQNDGQYLIRGKTKEDLEIKGFLVASVDDVYTLIPKDNVISFTVGFTLEEYINHFIQDNDTDSMRKFSCIAEIGDRLYYFKDAFNLDYDKKEEYIIVESFGDEEDEINFTYLSKKYVVSIKLESEDSIEEYKPVLLFDKDLLKFIGNDTKVVSENKDKVIDLINELNKVGINQYELLSLYKMGYYNLEEVPEPIKYGLTAMIEANEVYVEGDEGTVESNTSSEVEVEEAPDIIQFPEFNAHEFDVDKELYDEVEKECHSDIEELKAMSEEEFIKNLRLAHEYYYTIGSEGEMPTILMIESEYISILESTTNESIDIDSDDFKINLYNFVLNL